MVINQLRIKNLISQFNLTDLFIEELGWNHPPRSLPLQVAAGNRSYALTLLAEKSGFQVFACTLAAGELLPDANTRLKLERQLTPLAAEHLLVFLTPDTQFWQWARREPNAPIKLFKETYTRGADGERLAQKLVQLAFSIAEEARGISVTEVSRRTKQAFYAEKVTKSFYAKFKTEHEAFLKQIKGIDDEENRKWYASLMLNRLMFVYFIQRKGFLDGDTNYLKNRLTQVKAQLGKDKFHSFYRSFLLRLFHEGLGAQPHSAELVKLIGRVPYLNGGLFEVHQLETDNQQIEIPDKAFARIFEFFDEYDWHLDSRPLGNEREINPDVLGYIFEQYINNKQMGAYYTKEDITEYISKNTILPFLFDRAAKDVAIAFDAKDGVWQLLKADPDRYLYEAVRKGVIDGEGNIIELPADIAAGIDEVAKRDGWNKAADARYALPTETWREHVARRKRCLELRDKLNNGAIHTVNDLITWNLDIRQFAQDVILQTDSPDLVRAIYRAIAGRVPEKSNEHFEHGVTVLDPTCGSGAFLFAALNILQPLYEACLDRMEAFVAEADRAGATQRYPDFRRALQQINDHPNRDYFILKSIIIGNLYGVDIMEEAVEICKLRLFLKLAAQVERDERKPNYGLEPLPDIDFNIRAGNTLVGFTDRTAVEAAFAGEGQGKFDFDNHAEQFNEEAEAAERAFEQFRLQQTKLGGAITPKDKAALRARLKKLSDKLDVFLAHEYGVNTSKGLLFEAWRKSHQPFHWYTEFFGIIKSGGFDVVIGNPPYVEYSKVKGTYSVKGCRSLASGNLYACVVEKSNTLILKGGRVGFIVPLSLVCTKRTDDLRRVINENCLWISCFDMRPGSLFEGIAQRLCITLSTSPKGSRFTFVGGYRRWSSDERSFLIQNTAYALTSNNNSTSEVIPKLSTRLEQDLLSKIQGPLLEQFWDDSSTVIYIHRIVRYFIKALDFAPMFIKSDGSKGKSEDYKEFHFVKAEQFPILALLNSSLFYWFWRSHSDGFHCGYGDIFLMPYKQVTDSGIKTELQNLVEQLMKSLKKTSVEKAISTKAGTIRYQEFYTKLSKPIIDEIDRVLAQHYGFTDEELDFLLNYDIKYRMGRDGEE